MMTNGDPTGRIFLSFSQMNKGLLILLTTVFIYLIINLFIYLFQNKLPEVPECAEMQLHMMTLLDVLGKIAWIR